MTYTAMTFRLNTQLVSSDVLIITSGCFNAFSQKGQFVYFNFGKVQSTYRFDTSTSLHSVTNPYFNDYRNADMIKAQCIMLSVFFRKFGKAKTMAVVVVLIVRTRRVVTAHRLLLSVMG